MIELGRRLHRGVRSSIAQPGVIKPGDKATSAITIDEHVPCDSGEIHIFGTVSDSGIGTVSVRYVACRQGDTTSNGNATMSIAAFDPGVFGPIDYTITFTRLTLSGATPAVMSGSLHSHLDIPTRTETITDNLIVLFASGAMMKSERVEYEDVYNDLFNPTSYTERLRGRVFHSVHGWVDISTPVALRFSTLTQEFPDNGLVLLTTGPGGPGIQVTALSLTLLNLGLDLDGNGAFEKSAKLSWTDLPGPVGANLDDSDGDGMHDGWEIANNFDLNDPANALADADADGATNRAEYNAGTNPRSAGSMPPSVGVSIQATSDAPDPAFVGGNLTYTFTVSNSGNLAANDVVVTDPVPAGVNLVSATAAQGSCLGTTTVTCNLGTVNGFTGVTVTIVVSPTAMGSLSNTATVSTSSFDPIATDNSATSVTLVGLPGAGIQGRIDVASPGDTIIVDPGTYIGPLNFGGKNITLRSRDGAATTFIHGNGGVHEAAVVEMGPGGALIGFTIAGGQASFGAGVKVNAGTGSLIAENIFDGNFGNAGGYGAAIGGNSAGVTTIERNVFRNNSCDNQFIAGAVAFVNDSAPRIVNNVFANNTCRAINMTLPQGNAVEVINNTFVGNRTAIRVDARVPQTTQIYRNNILVQNGIGLELEFGNAADNPVWTNNLVFGNTTDYSGVANLTGTSGNISADPSFVNQAGGNYDLQAGSPAIGAGASLNAPAADFDNIPRGASIDIGAFEGP